MRYLSDDYLKYMRQYVGKPVIRIKPTEDGNYCFTEKIVLLDFINYKEIRISWEDNSSRKFGLASPYLDENWVPLEYIFKYSHPEYLEYEGKWVKRKPNFDFDASFTRTTYKKDYKYFMNIATKTHLFISEYDDQGKILPFILHTSRDVSRNWILDPEFN